MTQHPSIAVTGATGNVGGSVARALSEAGTALWLVVRSRGRAPVLPGAAVAETSYGDHDAAVAALADVDTLFMVSASESADRLDQHRTFVDAAVRAGVQHIVYTSFLNAAPDATFTLARDHWATEEHIRASGVQFTFLRDSFYIDFLPSLAGADGVIRGPAGDGAVGAVARADVARVATAVLSDPASHRGETYDLTGRESITFDEVARILTETSGRTVTFHNETIDEAYESRKSYGAPDWQLDAWVSTYTAIAAGELAAVTDSVETITGRPPMTLRDFIVGSA
ncbi:SDR family oxidoreductase [Williamsia muralis]|uniref:SDR family oxidoreductase n=1 Tax=Williamsia marianensis TaxID=85044 RepID=A0ABU4EQU3_WILMA|nr:MULTISPECIES: SDR family oxidoreductase [Williamsia]MDV7133618.1 SDR family oxidoreductase [Williamsia muralis]PVY30921.1 uncharacterized protein YbjT (DUF2867 family) [Williamsia marianensis]